MNDVEFYLPRFYLEFYIYAQQRFSLQFVYFGVWGHAEQCSGTTPDSWRYSRDHIGVVCTANTVPTVVLLQPLSLSFYLLIIDFEIQMIFASQNFFGSAHPSCTLGKFWAGCVLVLLWMFGFLRNGGKHAQQWSGLIPGSMLRDYSWHYSGDHKCYQRLNWDWMFTSQEL